MIIAYTPTATPLAVLNLVRLNSMCTPAGLAYPDRLWAYGAGGICVVELL